MYLFAELLNNSLRLTHIFVFYFMIISYSYYAVGMLFSIWAKRYKMSPRGSGFLAAFHDGWTKKNTVYLCFGKYNSSSPNDRTTTTMLHICIDTWGLKYLFVAFCYILSFIFVCLQDVGLCNVLLRVHKDNPVWLSMYVCKLCLHFKGLVYVQYKWWFLLMIC